jgi:hypothetical protein
MAWWATLCSRTGAGAVTLSQVSGVVVTAAEQVPHPVESRAIAGSECCLQQASS